VITVILEIYISQGSVATQLRCGGILLATLLQILLRMTFVSVEKFKNRSVFGEDADKNLRLTFLGPPGKIYDKMLHGFGCKAVFASEKSERMEVA